MMAIEKHEVIYGPPGTGKTRTLINRMADHVRHKNGRVLFCSHTKAAAATAVSRWGTQAAGSTDIQTLHSFCFRECKLSRSQTVDFAKLAWFVDQFGLDMEEGGEGTQYMDIISYGRCSGIEIEDAYDRSTRPGSSSHFTSFVESYENWKAQFGYVDFNDMLRRYVGQKPRNTGHSLMIVDESQDLTPLHWQVVEQFMTGNPEAKVIIAGDDDQCIYGYTGALAMGARLFAERHRAGEQVLSQSYRVPRQIHARAQEVARRIDERVPKEYQPRDADGVVEEYGYFDIRWVNPAHETLILFGDKFTRRELVEPDLIDAAIPFHSLGGEPSPMQSKMGAALTAVQNRPMSDADYSTVKRCLNRKGISVWDMGAEEVVCSRLRDMDFTLTNVRWRDEQYLRSVDWKAPVNIRIGTIHSAKGMEARVVHLLTGQSQSAVAYSMVDSNAAHRLFYVGVTRASEQLYIHEGDNGYEI